jgi:hypothetical protein
MRAHDDCAVRKRRLYLGLLLLLVVGGMIGVSVTGALREHEPTYAGKRLSEWVMRLSSKNSLEGESEAEEAIRHIGTNSLPYLLKWISYEPAPWRIKLFETAGTFLKKGLNALFQDRQILLSAGAARAFGGLRRGEAEQAMGTINRMAKDPKLGLSRVCANVALQSWKNEGLGLVPEATERTDTDTFSLTYGQNGVPVFTVSHTNTSRAMRVVPGRMTE